ncbi:hypothetical protein [Frigoriflavimonas asaccharolytica]|uniref:Uncharacterized protein with PQ loop repeat n=1 Tax=Frigoriflavimonas asaccharolytica TaxID=2735899 RepID=A0A8J8G8N4_9FLAO|nr:hypothetical protein [Frigoriflavimonas asaccharolytica]NRS91315.1 uncharacterized protein with PQ loop repeat [Frigoriflavimonas asaccharolytica]
MKKFKTQYLPYFPMFGLVLYVVLFTYASNYYPGGSTNHPEAKGYSFFNNLLCDAMDPITKGGMQNNARSLATVAHYILSLTMICFFYYLPQVFSVKNLNTKLTAYFGMATMTVFVLMSTKFHDVTVLLTGIFGTIAMIPFFIELYRFKNKAYKGIVYFAFALSIVCFLIFETKIGIYYLPILQKFTFGVDAIWVAWTCILVLKKNKNTLDLAH